jgi:hypothetical protein
MKLITLIFVTYISLLTIQPVLSVFASISNKRTECCNQNTCNNNQPKKKSEQHKQCNPFVVCSLCCGFFLSEFPIKNVIFDELKYVQTYYIENKKSHFLSNYFQPPEII